MTRTNGMCCLSSHETTGKSDSQLIFRQQEIMCEDFGKTMLHRDTRRYHFPPSDHFLSVFFSGYSFVPLDLSIRDSD